MLALGREGDPCQGENRRPWLVTTATPEGDYAMTIVVPFTVGIVIIVILVVGTLVNSVVFGPRRKAEAEERRRLFEERGRERDGL